MNFNERIQKSELNFNENLNHLDFPMIDENHEDCIECNSKSSNMDLCNYCIQFFD